MSFLVAEKYSIKEAAYHSDLGIRAVYDLFHEGRITGYQRKQGARIVIFKESLEEYLREIQNG